MNDFFIKFLEKLSTYENSSIFAYSIIPYSIFLYYLYKINSIGRTVKIGFSLTIFFVFITIILSIISQLYFQKSLVEVDFLHGLAESFLTLSDAVILIGFLGLLRRLEVNNS